MSIKKYLSKIPSFENKKIIITGATSGIGLELARHLLSKDAELVLLARNLSKADSVKEEFLKEFPNGKISIVQYDQSDRELIDSAINEIKANHGDFYAIVANAGILYPKKGELSKQGYPLTIDTNYLGLRYFLDKVIPLFNNKRYVMMGSMMANYRVPKNPDIYSDKYSLFKQYNMSKGCVEALWHHYQENNGTNDFILAEPGVVSTGIFRGFNWLFRVVGGFLVKLVCHSAKKAALTLLLSLTTTSKNGDYIVPRGLLTISGYPKYKKFPKNRKREYLINQ